MHIDIFFIEGEGYLISVLTPLDFLMISRVKNLSKEALHAAVYNHLETVDSTVTHILCDGEKGFQHSSMLQ
jgi:hypothetical protein